MKKLAVLISNAGSGTNLQAIIDATKQGALSAQISIVISDTEDAKGLKRATEHHLPTAIIPQKESLLPLLEKHQPDFVCLAGWKQIITDAVLTAFTNRILNMHPGAIPETMSGTVENPDGTKALWNKGMFTDSAIKNVLDKHATYASSTVHFLSSEFDFGPVLTRCFEKVRLGDTIDSLYTRLKQKENRAYVDALQKLCNSES